tara:strand:- start:21 stop:986 length:966 start_codon:yes stop_codon:yes gene_type:complete
MKFKIFNKSDLDLPKMKPFLTSFLPFAKETMGFDRPPSISFISDEENAEKILGKTAFYDPNNDSVVIYVNKRHPKDMLRSISHELVHHTQNCKGNFDKKTEMEEGYFQNDQNMREMEREAYEKGNMCFREWEETHRKQLEESIYYNTGDTLMKHSEWKNKALFGRLMENFGYGAPEEDETALEEGEEVVEEAMPMKADTEEDLDDDGKTDDEVPAFLKEEEEEVIEEFVGRLQEPVVEEGAEEGLPASMQRVLAQFAEEDVLNYLMSRKKPTGSDARGTGIAKTRRGSDAPNIRGVTAESSLEESKIREAVRKAVKKALNK